MLCRISSSHSNTASMKSMATLTIQSGDMAGWRERRQINDDTSPISPNTQTRNICQGFFAPKANITRPTFVSLLALQVPTHPSRREIMRQAREQEANELRQMLRAQAADGYVVVTKLGPKGSFKLQPDELASLL